MPSFCAAINCSNRSSDADNDVSYFRFPKDKDRCKRWVLNCRRKDLDGKSAVELNKNFRLCSNHFEETLYYPTNIGGKRLILEAIPTIFDFPDRPARVATNRKAPAKCLFTPPTEKLRAHSDNSLSEDGYGSKESNKKQTRNALLAARVEICRLRKEVRKLKLKLEERMEPPCDGSVEHILHLAQKFLSPGQVKSFHSQLTMSDKIKEEND